MFFEVSHPPRGQDPTRLTLEELISVQPRHIRGRLSAGQRGPEGERPGRGRASTLDFDGLSPYVPGDDTRAIDWRASMRCGDTTVRRFAAASHRAHMLVVDLRPDLFFGTARCLMAKTACLSAGWLAWNAHLLHEPVGMVIGSVTIAPRRGRRHVLRLLDVLVDAFSSGGDEIHVSQACETAAMTVANRDEICLITDLPMDTEPLAQVGRALFRTRVLRLMLVEDPLVAQRPPEGRYPVGRPSGQRNVIRVARSTGAENLAEARLQDAGWRVVRALDLLPRQNAP